MYIYEVDQNCDLLLKQTGIIVEANVVKSAFSAIHAVISKLLEMIKNFISKIFGSKSHNSDSSSNSGSGGSSSGSTTSNKIQEPKVYEKKINNAIKNKNIDKVTVRNTYNFKYLNIIISKGDFEINERRAIDEICNDPAKYLEKPKTRDEITLQELTPDFIKFGPDSPSLDTTDTSEYENSTINLAYGGSVSSKPESIDKKMTVSELKSEFDKYKNYYNDLKKLLNDLEDHLFKLKNELFKLETGSMYANHANAFIYDDAIENASREQLNKFANNSYGMMNTTEIKKKMQNALTNYYTYKAACAAKASNLVLGLSIKLLSAYNTGMVAYAAASDVYNENTKDKSDDKKD